jgi:hypothetical protein
MNGRVIDAQELGVAGIAFGGMSGGGGTELEEGSKARCYSEGNSVGVVNGHALQVLALAEAIHKALQALVRQSPVKLRLDVLLQAFPENFGSAGEIIT